ncbi:MAG: WXG100 family type VII secretion target [Clostridiales bacterium]|nr:WXG100 family type VII secretion target [Clostridiales bacterium]
MDGILKVTPAALRAKSGEFDQNRAAVRGLIEQMNAKVSGMNSVWQGDAATAYQTSYNGLRDDIERMDRMIAEHVRDLNELADVYARAESAVEAAAQALPKDAIQ